LKVSDLVIGPDGKPTAESLKKVLAELSKQAGKGTAAELTCTSEADEKKVYEYLEKLARDRDRKKYAWEPWKRHHCQSVAKNAVKVGRP
jgi:hypothetical protein